MRVWVKRQSLSRILSGGSRMFGSRVALSKSPLRSLRRGLRGREDEKLEFFLEDEHGVDVKAGMVVQERDALLKSVVEDE